MKSTQLLAAAVAAAFAAGGAMAAGDSKSKQDAASGATASPTAAAAGKPAGKKQPFSKLDTNNDGFLGHTEAAADADAKSKFHALDTNKDQKLSRSEYDAWGKTGAVAASDGKQSASAGATASPNAPIIVLVPVQLASRDTFSNGCWARLYDSTNFQGNQLSLVGPVDMPNMRTAFGTDWSGQFDSIAVGPKATLTVYDNENYGQKAATFKPGQKAADLDEKMGTFENISSVKVACAGGTPTAQSGKGNVASSGSTSASGGSAPAAKSKQ